MSLVAKIILSKVAHCEMFYKNYVFKKVFIYIILFKFETCFYSYIFGTDNCDNIFLKTWFIFPRTILLFIVISTVIIYFDFADFISCTCNNFLAMLVSIFSLKYYKHNRISHKIIYK